MYHITLKSNKVYRAVNKEVAEDELLNLEEKWGQKSPVVIESWQGNWDELSQYFQFTEPIRKIIYTTNAVEGFHLQVRKVTKTKGAFTNDMSLLKLVYLATKNTEKKWTAPLHNWSLKREIEDQTEFNLQTRSTFLLSRKFIVDLNPWI